MNRPDDDAPVDTPIAQELVSADPDAIERIWRRLEQPAPSRGRSWATGVAVGAAAVVAMALVYGLLTANAPPPSKASPAAVAEAARPTIEPAQPATGSLASTDTAHGSQSGSPPTASPRVRHPRKPSAEEAAPSVGALMPPPSNETATDRAPVVPTPVDETVRALAERHGPTAAGSVALLEAARQVARHDPPRGARIAEAGLAAGLPSSAALYVLISDGWAAAGERARAARAARAALRAAPDGPDAARMRQRALPDLSPR